MVHFTAKETSLTNATDQSYEVPNKILIFQKNIRYIDIMIGIR